MVGLKKEKKSRDKSMYVLYSMYDAVPVVIHPCHLLCRRRNTVHRYTYTGGVKPTVQP